MERIDKILSHLNFGSRKDVKKLIKDGFVVINNVKINDSGFKVDVDKDKIYVNNELVKYKKFVYIMLNKPKDVVSATTDPKYKTVIDLVSEYRKMNVFPIGRLDIDTEGLLVISNDGVLAHNLLAPKKHVDKKYYVKFEGEFKESYYLKFEKGIQIDDYISLPSKVIKISDNEVYIIIHEGKFHEIKNMFKKLNMEVIYLKRIKFKNLELDSSLALGEYRELTNNEIEDLKNEKKS